VEGEDGLPKCLDHRHATHILHGLVAHTQLHYNPDGTIQTITP
jgi:hypothetical protein